MEGFMEWWPVFAAGAGAVLLIVGLFSTWMYRKTKGVHERMDRAEDKAGGFVLKKDCRMDHQDLKKDTKGDLQDLRQDMKDGFKEVKENMENGMNVLHKRISDENTILTKSVGDLCVEVGKLCVLQKKANGG